MVDLDSSPDDFVGRLTALRVYAGYAGWGADQLDGEIADGSWHVVPAAESDPFTPSPNRLWRDVLRRQPPPLSMLATLPEDASLN
jgi:putative transcriptional regulator